MEKGIYLSAPSLAPFCDMKHFAHPSRVEIWLWKSLSNLSHKKNSPSFLAALCAVNLKKGLSYMTSTQKGDLIYLRTTDK